MCSTCCSSDGQIPTLCAEKQAGLAGKNLSEVPDVAHVQHVLQNGHVLEALPARMRGTPGTVCIFSDRLPATAHTFGQWRLMRQPTTDPIRASDTLRTCCLSPRVLVIRAHALHLFAPFLLYWICTCGTYCVFVLYFVLGDTFGVTISGDRRDASVDLVGSCVGELHRRCALHLGGATGALGTRERGRRAALAPGAR